MSKHSYVPLDIGEFWADLTDHLCELVDTVPEGKMDWSPTPEMWNFRGLFVHIVAARHHWLAVAVRDGEETPDYAAGGQTNQDLKEQLRLSWERMARFISDPQRLSARYMPPPDDPVYLDPAEFNGHYIAYHRLLHDVHHRADIIGYLTQLGVQLPPERRRRPLY